MSSRISSGVFSVPHSGVMYRSADQAAAQRHAFFRVLALTPGSPAQREGIRPGRDIVDVGFALNRIAVIVLYAVRLLRTQTDRAVTRLFFAARLRRIDAIHALAREVDAVQTPAAIPAFVVASLRATLAPARIAPAGELGGAMVFPLAVRGQLRGGLVCAVPDADDDFAPDEADALARLAIATAIARDDLIAERLRARVASLEQENRLLSRLAGLESPASATSEFATE